MNPPSTGYTIGGAASGTATAPLTVSSSQASLTADFIPIYSAALQGTYAINIENLLGIGSQVVSTSDPQTIGSKTFSNSNSYTALDGSFTLQHTGATTKQATFALGGITAGQTRVITLPDYNASMASLAGTETLTNKTLTAPTTTAISNTGGLATDTLSASGAATLSSTLAVSGQPTFQGGTAVPAGGSQAAGILVSSTAHLGVYFGSGVPTLSAAQGSFYMRTDGSTTTTRCYVNTNGSTGWTAMVTNA